jgi:hypothetical protein
MDTASLAPGSAWIIDSSRTFSLSLAREVPETAAHYLFPVPNHRLHPNKAAGRNRSTMERIDETSAFEPEEGSMARHPPPPSLDGGGGGATVDANASLE